MKAKAKKKASVVKPGQKVGGGVSDSRPAPRYKARGRYKIVDGPSQSMIEPSSTETRTEDQILNQTRRAKLLDLTRNLVRNSSLFNTVLGQLSTNAISTCGGKVVISTPNEEANMALKKAFFAYTRNVDFHTGDTLNHLLKRTLREYVIGGDCVLLFDDELVEDSGKVLLFESNQIVNVALPEVEKRYGKGSWISNGKVYSRNGRHIGTVVSRSQTQCLGDADPDACYFLKKYDVNGNPVENYWYHFSSNWREGRGVSQAASAIATIHQLEDLVQSELLASRRNSQIFCWLTENKDPQEEMPSAFDGDLNADDISNMSDEDIEKLAKEEAEAEKVVSFNRAKENSVVYEALPPGFDAKQLTMTHPNQNVQTMVDWLANRCAASMGLSKVFATGNPEDGNWRSNQLFSWPAIRELQKDLEQVLDWLFFRFITWAQRKGFVKAYIAEDFMDFISWEWRGIDDLSPVEYQNGIRLALENNTKTYREILGNNWKERLEQTAYEHQWMSEHGITPVGEKLLSGGQTEASKRQVQEVNNNEDMT